MPAPRRPHWYWMASLVMVMWSTLSSHSADASVLTFCQPYGFLLHLHSSLKTQLSLLIWSALKTMAVNSTASSKLQVEFLPRLSRNLSRCCEKGLSAPGVGFSNFETNYLVFSNTSTTKRLREWNFWYDKWFCSCKNLSRVLPSLQSNGKVSSVRRRWGSTALVQDTSVYGGMVANRFGLLVLCFSDWFFFPSAVRTKDLWSTFYV